MDYCQKGEIHFTNYYENTHVIESESWYLDGKPSLIKYYKNGKIESYIKYYSNSQIKFEQQYYKNGKIYYEEWYQDNKLHSLNDKPAKIVYNSNGDVHIERWYHCGKLHRDNNPAYVKYYYNNKIEKWYYNGKKLIN